MAMKKLNAPWRRITNPGSHPRERPANFPQAISSSSKRNDAASHSNALATSLALKKFPLIGVVTPVRNRHNWTVGFARTLCQQDYPLFKLYIVDSASTDGTPDAIRQLGASTITVIDAPSSFYWTAATNVGVSHALQDGCDYILTLNDDAVIPQDFITRIVSSAEKRGALVVGSVISYVNEPGRLWGVGAHNNWRNGEFVQTKFANLWEDALPSAPPPGAGGLIETDYLCGNGTLIHHSVFQKIGLYDQKNMPHYHSDSEFTMRAEKAGIDRYVALDARLYNRFTEAGDGAFAAKNMRLFSLRSANYVRSLLFILHTYCPPEYRGRALILYFARYLRVMDARDRSKLLRAVKYLTTPADHQIPRLADLLPPVDPHLTLCEDINILCSLPPTEFVFSTYAYVFQRPCSEGELNACEDALATGRSRTQIILEFISSAEYRNVAKVPVGPEIKLLLGASQSNINELVKSAPDLGDSQFIIGNYIALCGRLPTRGEFRDSLRVLETSGRLAALASIRSTKGGGAIQDEAKRAIIFAALKRALNSEARAVHVPRLTDATTVYFNVDVLCMAITDPRARTGVHRYVSSLGCELLRDPRIDLRAFHSEELEASWRKLIIESPEWRAKEASRKEAIPDRSVVFYPYFPFGKRDPRLAALPKFMTLCDLFPLTHPEWFTPAASQTFRRQLHELVTADHIFCISKATEDNLRETFPSLKASSSVAYLSANIKQGQKRRRASKITGLPSSARYFVCVGTIEPRKNLLNVVAALRHFAGKRGVEDIHMIVVGQEGWKVKLQDLHALAGEHVQKVHFLGRVADDDLRMLYEGAVCTVFPSLAEGFGLPIIESFFCGTPVVTSNGSSMKEIAGDGGVLIDPFRPEEIAEAIALISSNAKLRIQLSDNAKRQAENFSWKKCAEDHVAEFVRLEREFRQNPAGRTDLSPATQTRAGKEPARPVNYGPLRSFKHVLSVIRGKKTIKID